MNGRSRRIFSVAVLLLCGVALIISGVAFSGKPFGSNGVKTDAVVGEIFVRGEENFVGLNYTAGGVKYYGTLAMPKTGAREGDKLTIFYDRENPANISFGGEISVVSVVFYAVGGICAFAAACFAASSLYAVSRLNRFKSRGTAVGAVVTGAYAKHNVAVFGVHPTRVVLRGDDGRVYEGRFLFDGGDLRVGDRVNVYLDRAKNKYAIDPEKTEEADNERHSFI